MLYRILRAPYIIYKTCLKYNILQSSLQEILKWNHYLTKINKAYRPNAHLLDIYRLFPLLTGSKFTAFLFGTTSYYTIFVVLIILKKVYLW